MNYILIHTHAYGVTTYQLNLSVPMSSEPTINSLQQDEIIEQLNIPVKFYELDTVKIVPADAITHAVKMPQAWLVFFIDTAGNTGHLYTLAVDKDTVHAQFDETSGFAGYTITSIEAVK